MERDTAYFRHWQRLEELLGPEQTAKLRKQLTADQRRDLHRKRAKRFKVELPKLRKQRQQAKERGAWQEVNRLTNAIAYRERILQEEGLHNA